MRYAKAAALVAALPLALAQTYTDCNPLEKECPAEVGLPSTQYVADFTTEAGAASWTLADGTSLTYGSDGAVFQIDSAGQAPTSKFCMIQLHMQWRTLRIVQLAPTSSFSAVASMSQ